MELCVDKYKRNSSKGDSFKILFEKKISLELAVETISAFYRSHTSEINDTSIVKDGSRHYGLINSDREFIVIKNDRYDMEIKLEKTEEYDIYRVTENNMGSGELEKFYRFLKKPFLSSLF